MTDISSARNPERGWPSRAATFLASVKRRLVRGTTEFFTHPYLCSRRFVDFVAGLPPRSSYVWGGTISVLAVSTYTAVIIARMISPLQLLIKSPYRYHRIQQNKALPYNLRTTRTNVPLVYTEAYFASELLLWWLLQRSEHGNSNLAITAFGSLVALEASTWIFYYLILRSFIEPGFQTSHGAENLFFFPLVAFEQVVTVAAIRGYSITHSLHLFTGTSGVGADATFVVLGKLYIGVVLIALVNSLPQVSPKTTQGIALVGAGSVAERILPALHELGYHKTEITVFDLAVPREAVYQSATVKHVQAQEQLIPELCRLRVPTIIATPMDDHLTYLTVLSAQGIPFAVEKPVVPGGEELQIFNQRFTQLMSSGFALSYYALEKALPLSYFWTHEPAYREFLQSGDGSEPMPELEALERLHGRLGALRSVNASLLESDARSPRGRSQLWTQWPPSFSRLIELAVHPIQLVLMMLGDDSNPVPRDVKLGRCAWRDLEVQRLLENEIGADGQWEHIGPTYCDISGSASGRDFSVRVGKYLPDNLAARRLFATFENGELCMDFDSRILRVKCDGLSDLSISVNHRWKTRYTTQLALFRYALLAEFSQGRIDLLEDQLRAINWWEKELGPVARNEAVIEYRPVVDDSGWPETLGFDPTPSL